MAEFNIDALGLARSTNELLNTNKVRTVFDFAFGEFMARRNFFDELSRLQNGLNTNNGKVKLGTGQEVDTNTIGGSLALKIYMETVDSRLDTMSGLSKLGLKNENKLLTLLT